MPYHITPEVRTQVIALLQTGHGISETARKCKISRPTVYSIQSTLSKGETPISVIALSKMDVAHNVRTLAESDTNRTVDRISAWKLYCLMMGYLTPEQAVAVQINLDNLAPSRLATLEQEYVSLRATAPSTLLNSTNSTSIDTTSSNASDSAEVSAADSTLAVGAPICYSEGEGRPPEEVTAIAQASQQTLPENFRDSGD